MGLIYFNINDLIKAEMFHNKAIIPILLDKDCIERQVSFTKLNMELDSFPETKTIIDNTFLSYITHIPYKFEKLQDFENPPPHVKNHFMIHHRMKLVSKEN